MCGITGFVTEKNFNIDNSKKNLRNMINKLNHRGPDSFGEWIYNNQLYFGHTRLSIQDLSPKANQPMFSNNDRFTIIFNGEIYNHKILRDELDYNWISTSDTETILALLNKYTFNQAINKLEGMYSLACFDSNEKVLYLARDFAGEKPLYFGWSNNVFFFSSELKPITESNYFNKDININAVNSLIQYSYIKTPHTIFNNFYKLPPNSILECKLDIYNYKNAELNDVFKKNNFFKIYKIDKKLKKQSQFNSNNNIKDNIDEFTKIFKDSIKSSFISDVPVGIFLSGGIDSSLTSLFAKKYTSNNFETFTIGFENSDYDESIYASKISKFLNIKNNKLIVTSQDMQNVVPKIAQIYDEPFSDSSQIPTYLLSKLASSNVKVAISGDGGDELFGGYNRYYNTNKLWNYIKYLPFSIRKYIAKYIINNKNLISITKILVTKFNLGELKEENIIKILNKLQSIQNKKTLYLSMLKEVNDLQNFNENKINNFDSIFDNYIKNNKNFTEAMMSYDFDNYLNDDILVKVDRASMSNSLEVRAPFLNKNIIKFSNTLPTNHKIINNSGKLILKEILKLNFPQSLIDRPKMGFGIPLREWLSNDLNSWMNDILSINNLKKHNLFDINKIEYLKQNLNSIPINKLWSVLVFQLWYEEYF